jgi:hypothetical protein
VTPRFSHGCGPVPLLGCSSHGWTFWTISRPRSHSEVASYRDCTHHLLPPPDQHIAAAGQEDGMGGQHPCAVRYNLPGPCRLARMGKQHEEKTSHNAHRWKCVSHPAHRRVSANFHKMCLSTTLHWHRQILLRWRIECHVVSSDSDHTRCQLVEPRPYLEWQVWRQQCIRLWNCCCAIVATVANATPRHPG